MVSDLESIAEEKWKDNVIFADYKLAFDSLNKNDKHTQRTKFTHYFRYVKESLVKHLKPWTTELVFFSIFTNQPTKIYTARLILGSSSQL